MVFDPLLADYNEFLSDFILNFACVSMINHLDNRKKTRAKKLLEATEFIRRVSEHKISLT